LIFRIVFYATPQSIWEMRPIDIYLSEKYQGKSAPFFISAQAGGNFRLFGSSTYGLDSVLQKHLVADIQCLF